MDVCAGLVAMALPLSLKSEFGLSDDMAGLIIGTSTLVYMVSAILAGMFADRLGAGLGIRIGAIIILLDSLAFCFCGTLPLFILCALGSPLGHAFFWPSIQSWFAQDVDRREIARRIGIFSVGWSIGLSVVGPKLAGDLMEYSNRWPFVACCIISAAVFCFFQFVRPELPRHEIHPTQEADDLHPVEIRRRFLRGARIANLMAVYAIVTMRNFVPMVCVDWNLPKSQIGTVVMVLGISQCLTFLFLSTTHRWHFRSRYLLSGQTLGMIGLLAFGLGGILFLSANPTENSHLGVLLAMPALILTGAMAGIAFVSSAFYGLFGQEEKGKNSGINESIIGAAGVLAAYLGGASVRGFGSMGPYLTSGVLVGICLVFQVFLLRPHRRGNG
jgi:predicted MFS family arabinose efflux permease